MRWLPPAPDRQDFLLERWNRLTFIGAARQPARTVFDFVGIFESEEHAVGTKLTHSYEFSFKGPFRLAERALRGWLQNQITDEVAAIAEHFDSSAGEDDRP